MFYSNLSVCLLYVFYVYVYTLLLLFFLLLSYVHTHIYIYTHIPESPQQLFGGSRAVPARELARRLAEFPSATRVSQRPKKTPTYSGPTWQQRNGEVFNCGEFTKKLDLSSKTWDIIGNSWESDGRLHS